MIILPDYLLCAKKGCVIANMKPLSIAVEELYEGKVKIVGNGDDSEVM